MNPYILFPVVWILAITVYSLVMYSYMKNRLFKEKYALILRTSLTSIWLISIIAIAITYLLVL